MAPPRCAAQGWINSATDTLECEMYVKRNASLVSSVLCVLAKFIKKEDVRETVTCAEECALTVLIHLPFSYTRHLFSSLLPFEKQMSSHSYSSHQHRTRLGPPFLLPLHHLPLDPPSLRSRRLAFPPCHRRVFTHSHGASIRWVSSSPPCI